MPIVMSKCFLRNPENKFGAVPSCYFQEKRKKQLIPTHSNPRVGGRRSGVCAVLNE